MKLKELRYKIGLSLSIVGVTIGMLLNFFFPFVTWSPVIMLLSVFLLLGTDILKAPLKINKYFKAIIFYQLFMIICAFMSDYSEPVLKKYLPFHLYIIALSFVLVKNRDLKNVNFIPTLFIITSILSIIGAIITYLDLIRLDIQLRQEEAVLERFTLNIAIYTNFIAGLYLLRNKKLLLKLIILLFFLIDIYIIVQNGKRSYFVAILLASLFYLYTQKYLIKGLFCIAFCGVIFFICAPQIREESNTIISNTWDGFYKVFIAEDENTYYDENDSASIRRYNKQKVFKDLRNNFTILHFFTGKGYYYAYIDNPLFESFILLLYCNISSF